jgi:hypothetical protein
MPGQVQWGLWGPALSRNKNRRSSGSFEYERIFIWGGGEKTSRVLNEYGREGWELVCTYWCWHYMKRVLA